MKIGLAIRLVQNLRLNAEPDSSLPPWQQEEHRRVFWSVYLLDKFVSCGKSRPPSILDVDCTLALPCSEEAFRMEMDTDMPSIALVQDLPSNRSALLKLDHFALLVLICSTLSLTVRDTFQETPSTVPPWDCRSKFAEISSLIMSFENTLTAGSDDLEAYITSRFSTYEGFDRQRVGHFVWTRAVYHLCGSLLYHPVNLRRHRIAQGHDFPKTFARELLDRCKEHASQLSNILQTLRATGCCARGSFLGYVGTCAISIHQIYAHSPDSHVATQAKLCSDMCLSFLEHVPVRWPNHGMMAASLKAFNMDAERARLLIDPSPHVVDVEIESAHIEQLWNIIDYGWLTDPAHQNYASPSPFSYGLDAQIVDWTSFLDSQMGEDGISSTCMTQPDIIIDDQGSKAFAE